VVRPELASRCEDAIGPSAGELQLFRELRRRGREIHIENDDQVAVVFEPGRAGRMLGFQRDTALNRLPAAWPRPRDPVVNASDWFKRDRFGRIRPLEWLPAAKELHG
jgi:hypothetical protein